MKESTTHFSAIDQPTVIRLAIMVYWRSLDRSIDRKSCTKSAAAMPVISAVRDGRVSQRVRNTGV